MRRILRATAYYGGILLSILPALLGLQQSKWVLWELLHLDVKSQPIVMGSGITIHCVFAIIYFCAVIILYKTGRYLGSTPQERQQRFDCQRARAEKDCRKVYLTVRPQFLRR